MTQGEDSLSGYCPLDLYSGDEARVTRAVHALWAKWLSSKGTANNLRVFVRGETIDPNDVRAKPVPMLRCMNIL
jgi:inositol-pentakisphosphate 2-kinase